MRCTVGDTYRYIIFNKYRFLESDFTHRIRGKNCKGAYSRRPAAAGTEPFSAFVSVRYDPRVSVLLHNSAYYLYICYSENSCSVKLPSVAGVYDIIIICKIFYSILYSVQCCHVVCETSSGQLYLLCINRNR